MVNANQTPVSADDIAITIEDITLSIDVLANDADADGDTISLGTFVATTENGGITTRDGSDKYVVIQDYIPLLILTFIRNNLTF